jgi:hypothetical protein
MIAPDGGSVAVLFGDARGVDHDAIAIVGMDGVARMTEPLEQYALSAAWTRDGQRLLVAMSNIGHGGGKVVRFRHA